MAALSDHQLYKSILDLEVIPKAQLNQAYSESKKTKKLLSDLLVGKDLISDVNLGKVVADIFSLPFVDLSNKSIEKDILSIIPEVVAKKQNIIAFEKDTEGLHLATTNPENKQIVSFVEKKVGIPVKPYYATQSDIDKALKLYRKDIKSAFEDIIQENVKKAKGAKSADPSIIKIIDTLVSYAYQNLASDIHIEPIENKSLVRFRIDGILHDIVNLPISFHDQMVTRIKIMAKLRTDEHQSAQDGKISHKVDSEKVEMRVSIVPITDGEKIVMRILSEKSRQFSLLDLGFSEADIKKVKSAYSKPHGMILSTGPTGSGKTTTLYSILKVLNNRDVNIMTIEDPVEYDIEGVNQIQVNTRTELTFAKGLRSIVRQDPDIILVGEIRDDETANIAVNAAMTGHLVLSTLHTNDAATTIPRLIDLNIEPFLVASTVNVIVAQRLVRKICTTCRISEEVGDLQKRASQKTEEVDGRDLKLIEKYFGESESVRIYRGKGCEVCHHTGYIGRLGIFEILVVDEKIREAIMGRKNAEVIRGLAIEQGMVTMFENGLAKVKEGLTTLDEILRVTKE